MPIHVKVSGVNHVYGTGEANEFVVTHSNFGYYQEYSQYEIFGEDSSASIINGGMIDSIHHTPFTIPAAWQGIWKVRKYIEHIPIDQDENKLGPGHKLILGAWFQRQSSFLWMNPETIRCVFTPLQCTKGSRSRLRW